MVNQCPLLKVVLNPLLESLSRLREVGVGNEFDAIRKQQPTPYRVCYVWHAAASRCTGRINGPFFLSKTTWHGKSGMVPHL
jgi:hypothetical protein